MNGVYGVYVVAWHPVSGKEEVVGYASSPEDADGGQVDRLLQLGFVVFYSFSAAGEEA